MRARQESVIGQPHSPAQLAGSPGLPGPGFPQPDTSGAPQWKPTASASSPPSRPVATLDVRTVPSLRLRPGGAHVGLVLSQYHSYLTTQSASVCYWSQCGPSGDTTQGLTAQAHSTVKRGLESSQESCRAS